jgi:hypothetical protein
MSRQIRIGTNLATDTKTTLYTVPDRVSGIWTMFYAFNSGANNKYINLYWYDKSNDREISILNGYTLNAKAYILFNGAEVVLEQGDEIRVQLESSAAMSVIATLTVAPELSVKKNSNGV